MHPRTFAPNFLALPALLVLALSLAAPLAAQTPAPGDILHSPSGQLRIEITRIPEKNEAWLVSSRDGQRRLLHRFPRDLDAVFSPDDSRIALVDWESSDRAVVLVFERRRDLEYARLDADVDTPAWKACARSLGVPGPEVFANRYTAALSWSGDSGALLLRLTGMLETGELLSGFHCIYDLAARKVLLDLARMNKTALARRP
ncbi:hypothetical protein NNJEOMEG_00350 [Fundidesulfovibrio magnetotacticus]|uniref:Uncharacterized protein n=1 Tax=Fundidesulfovibrio magnetotacticus TaxID=2730080 RepID=A0A6V8LW76_9BACT|nr:hypothetical protein [Fundidesulfovibrio magnetotacticus]GFK92525.1 hypothetical protein NNJEOMEG_00350 [Fundidesulfovibrio magnetotacticus]